MNMKSSQNQKLAYRILHYRLDVCHANGICEKKLRCKIVIVTCTAFLPVDFLQTCVLFLDIFDLISRVFLSEK